LHEGKRSFDGFGQHVKECSGTDGPEDYAGAILVRFDTEVYTCFLEELLETQGVLETFGNINQHRGFSFEELCFLLHRPIVNLLA